MKKAGTKNASIPETLSGVLRRRRHSVVGVGMTPLIDMIFLLLIFFLVTANFRLDEGYLPIRLPTARAEELPLGRAEPLAVSISGAGDGSLIQVGPTEPIQIKTQSLEADLALLAQRLVDVMRAQKRIACDPIEIVCEGNVSWEHLVKVYNLLFGMGIEDITFRMTADSDG